MSIILEIHTKNVANFGHEGFGAFLFVLAVHVVTPVNFVDFAGGSTGRGSFEIAGEGNHGDVTGFLIETDGHDGVSELSAIMGAVTFVAFHVVTTSAESEDVSTTVFIGFEGFVGGFSESDEVENITLAASNFGDNIVTPDNKPDNTCDENENNNKKNTSNDFAFLGHGFFHFLGIKIAFGGMMIDGGITGFEFAGLVVKIKNLGRGEKVFGRGEGSVGGIGSSV